MRAQALAPRTKRHPAGGRAHERQADQVAARFLRGEKGLARYITPAPAAGFALPQSYGVPLFTGLRTELETAFGADLGAVRLHTDAPAASAALQFGAYAFASGADIYFGQQAHRTSGERARELLAHEVAHVLQQTGRAGSGGIVRAVDRRGAHGVQCWASPLDSTLAVPEVPALLAAHRDALDAAAPERATIERLLQGYVAEGEANQPAYVAARATHVTNDSVDPVLGDRASMLPAPVASALYDLLKRGYLWGPAAKLLDMRHDLQTRFFSAETYQQYMDDHAGDFSVPKLRFYRHWFSGPWFGTANPRFMLDRTLILLLGPTTVKPSKEAVAGGEPLVDAYRAELKRVDSGEMLPDELYFVTVRIARDVEALRLDTFELLLQQISRFPNYQESMRVRIKVALAHQLRSAIKIFRSERTKLLAKTEGVNRGAISREGFLVWFDDVLPALDAMAEYAIAYWDSVEAFAQSLFEGKPIPGTTETATQALQELEKHIPGYRAMLEDFLHALLDRNPDGTLPAPAAYASRRDAAVKRLENDMRRVVDRPLVDRLIDALPAASRPGFSFDRAIADKRMPLATRALIAWAQTLAIEFREMAVGYSADRDETLGRRAIGSAGAGDLRLLLRVRLAKRMVNVGRRAGWKEWLDWAMPILQAKESIAGTEMENDYIAFGTNWQLDPKASTGRMLKDLPNEVEGFEPLTTRDLVEFYLAMDYARISHHIDRQLQLRDKKYDLKQTPVLNQAFHDARAESRPQRYLVQDWEYVRPWEEKGGKTTFKPRQDFRQLLRDHPLTQALKNELKARQGGEPAWAVDVTLHEGKEALVFWSAPTPVQLVARVQAITAVNRALLAALHGLVSDPNVEPKRLAEINELRSDIESGKAYRDAGTPQAPAPVPLGKLTVPLLQALEPIAWWALWRAVLSGYPASERERLIKLMREGIVAAGLPALLAEERRQAFERVKLDERRAIAHQRRTIVEMQLRPTLKNFAPYSWDYYKIPGGKRTYKRLLAGETIDLLRRFLIQIAEQDERDSHQALALLEFSDVIADKIAGLTKLDEFYAWGPLIDDALFWANDPKKGGDAAVRDSFAVADERGNIALFEERRSRLFGVLTHIAEQFQRYFTKWGLVAKAGDGTIENPGTVRAVGESNWLGRGTVFASEGHTYEIIQVHTAFTFHPGAVRFRSLPPASTGGARLKIGDGDSPLLPPSEHPHTLLMHVIIDGDPEAMAIYADREEDAKLLAQITWALHMHEILQQLTALAAAMETFAEVLMDLAELFPVAGQAIAAARLVTAAMALITTDIPNIVADLVKNPAKALGEAWSQIQSLLSLGNLLEYLLFNNHSLNGLIRRPRAPGERNPGRSTSRRMKRLAHKLQNLARGAGRVFVRMQDAVQDRRQQVEHYVQGSPRVVRLVQLVADYYLLIASIADYLSQMPDRGEAVADFKEAGADLPGYLDELIASIGRIQLPKEILPLEELIHTLIDVVGHRLGGKYKLGVQILLKLLDAVGATDEVVGGIAKALRKAGVNTENVFPIWGNTIVPEVGKRLQSVQAALHDTLSDSFAAFGVDLKLAAPKAEVRLEGNDFPDPPADLPAGGAEAPETQPSLEGAVLSGMEQRAGGAQLDRAQVADLLRALPHEGGEPLTASARASAEARFGQDFSDVRLHRGGRAAGLARSLGMRALTSGSHIVMGSGESDRRLLYHELAHVVQQNARQPERTGLRTRPRRGRPGRGLRWDPRAERRADAAAAAALHGDASGVAIGATAEGWQPSLIQMLGQRFLRQITDISAIESEVAEIEKTGAGTGLRLIGKDVRKAVGGVANSLRVNFKPGKDALHAPSPSPYRKKLDAISTHLLNFLPEIRDAIEDIAIRASYEAERSRKGKPARMALNVRDFKRRLERFILGKTGILLDLNADTPRGNAREFKNVNAPFIGARVKFVFLPPIHGNSPLWQDALLYRGSQPIPAAERATWRTGIRAVLRELGPSSSIWVGDDYRLSDKVFKAVEERDRLIQTGAQSGKLPPSALPSTTDYVNTTAKSDTGNGNQRLHLGTYEQKKTGEQKGTDRESHHITQYLLVEYFHNGSSSKTVETDSERMGFPLLRKYRDKKPYGDKMTQKAGRPQSFGGIQITALEERRGGKMPTILLARSTHRNGNLHISPRGDDIDDTSTATQAGAVNALYKGALPAQHRRIEREVARGEKPYSDWETYAGRNNVGATIESAMQDTYAQIRKYMQKQLRTALVGIERDYYNDVYLAAHPQAKNAQPMTRGAMNKVVDDAIAHNRDGDKKRSISGMKDYGWTG